MNSATIASAGSGKTDLLVETALSVRPGESVVLTTFTDGNAEEIRRRFVEKAGRVPPNVTVIPWLSFLIQHGVKPYQHELIGVNEVRGLHFEPRRGKPKKADVRRYYLDGEAKVYRDFLAEFAVLLDDRSGGAAIKRLEDVFDHFMFDELQDIAARDFEFLEKLLRSRIAVTLMGDPRQGTFSTAQSTTNRGFTRSGIVKWLEKMRNANLLEIRELNESFRCNQPLCDFSDALYPDFPVTTSRNVESTGHDGVFLVTNDHVAEYVNCYAPQLLVWDKTFGIPGYRARNFGEVKGLTFDRVLVNPTGTIGKFIQKGSKLPPVSIAKFYVGVTRARHSVAIILNEPGSSEIEYWSPDVEERSS